MSIQILDREILRSNYPDSAAFDYIQFRFRVQNATAEDIKSFDNSYIEVSKNGSTKQFVFQISVPQGTTSGIYTTGKYLIPPDFFTGSDIRFEFPVSSATGQNLVTHPISDFNLYYLGCTDPNATNYNPAADTDDGSCTLPALGCTDPNSLNYDSAATSDDGSCVYTFPVVKSEILIEQISQAPILYRVRVTTQVENITGAQISVRSIQLKNGGWGFKGTNSDFTIAPNSVSADYVRDFTAQEYWGSNDPEWIEYEFSVGEKNRLMPGEFTVIRPGCTDPNAINYDPKATQDDGSCIIPVPGCTNPNATNYDPTANVDDGSCIVPGCTSPNATNYDAQATVDDGSCLYPERSGFRGWATLEEYDILTGVPTGNEKPNVPADPDHVLPVYRPDLCPPGEGEF